MKLKSVRTWNCVYRLTSPDRSKSYLVAVLIYNPSRHPFDLPPVVGYWDKSGTWTVRPIEAWRVA